MTNDFLLRFIQSLDKGEWEYCRDRLSRETAPPTEIRIKIFDALTEMAKHSQTELLVKLEGSVDEKTLALQKTRLYRQLVNYLLVLHRTRKPAKDPIKKLEEARVLVEIGMLEDAVVVLDSAIKMAVKSEDLFTEVTLRELLREAFKSLDRAQHQDAIIHNEYQLQTAVDKLGRLVQYTQINDRMWDYDRTFKSSTDIDINKARNELISRPEMRDRNLADSLPAQLRYFNTWCLQHSHNGQQDEALECHRTLVELWESNPDYLDRLPNFYLNALSNYIGKLIMSGKAEKCLPLLKKMEAVKTNGRRAEILRFQSVEVQYQLYAMNTGQLKKVINREPIILKGLSKYGKQLRTGTRITLVYNLGVSHLISGNFGDALKRFNELRDFGTLDARQDLQGLARLFRLVLICENDTSGAFEHYLRNGKRFFSEGNRAFALENLIYDWLKTHHSIKDDGEKRQSFKELVAELEPLVSNRTVGAEEFLLYARAKAERKDINELFLKSIGK